MNRDWLSTGDRCPTDPYDHYRGLPMVCNNTRRSIPFGSNFAVKFNNVLEIKDNNNNKEILTHIGTKEGGGGGVLSFFFFIGKTDII